MGLAKSYTANGLSLLKYEANIGNIVFYVTQKGYKYKYWNTYARLADIV